MSTAEDREADRLDNVRDLLHDTTDIDKHGQRIWSPLRAVDEDAVAEYIASLVAQSQVNGWAALRSFDLTAEADEDQVNVVAWAKDSTGRSVTKEFLLIVEEQ